MEQRQNTVLTEREKEKRRQEIMNIQDRKKRHESIARNSQKCYGYPMRKCIF